VLTYSVEGAVAWAVLDRPEKLNAMARDFWPELTAVVERAAADPQVRVLAFRGEGRCFSVGGDIASFGELGDAADRRAYVGEALGAYRAVEALAKPTIAAVHGHALGGGCELTLVCDVVVAGPSSVFADTHVNMGIGAGDGGQVIWPFLIGVNKAKYFLMTGDRIKGKEAEELGLVNFYVEDDAELMPKALEIAERLASGAPQAVAASKMAINAYLRSVSSMVMPICLKYEQLTMQTEDHREAVRAFQEKRPPRFTGK